MEWENDETRTLRQAQGLELVETVTNDDISSADRHSSFWFRHSQSWPALRSFSFRPHTLILLHKQDQFT
jgi:hypothetical protein